MLAFFVFYHKVIFNFIYSFEVKFGRYNMNLEGTKNKNTFLNYLKGALVALSTTLILILLFAVLVRFLNISDSWIFPINQVIKVISLTLGLSLMLKDKEKGFVKGLILGIIYYLLSFVIFSILQAKFSISIKNLYDFLLTTFASGLIGIILVNIKK